MQSHIKLTKAHLAQAYHNVWLVEAWWFSPYVLSLYLGVYVGLFHKGNHIWYSFVFTLITLSNLTDMGKIQKNISTWGRSVGHINTNTKE